jgi:hypothetical protein
VDQQFFLEYELRIAVIDLQMYSVLITDFDYFDKLFIQLYVLKLKVKKNFIFWNWKRTLLTSKKTLSFPRSFVWFASKQKTIFKVPNIELSTKYVVQGLYVSTKQTMHYFFFLVKIITWNKLLTFAYI